MSSDLEQRYDSVPYRGGAFERTHPDRLAGLGVLCGLDPAPMAGARVLEIGCGDGGNLIPLAFVMPQARFLGFDLSGEAVARGRVVVADVGLRNIELRQQDIMAFDAAEGPFDYVIAHGVYSWVPDAVRLRLLDLIRAVLAPHGLAFVSYSALPGGFLDELRRQMLLRHVRDIADPANQVNAARGFVRRLAELSRDGGLSQAIFADGLDALQRKRDTVVLHDDLSPVVHREWSHTFRAAAGAHGLRVICESGWSVLEEQSLAPEMQAWLAAISPDEEVRAEYRDILLLRRFREDVLCRADAPETHTPIASRIPLLRLRAAVRVVEAAAAQQPVEFRSDAGIAVAIADPLTQAALRELGRAYPYSIGFDELHQRARAAVARLGSATASSPAQLADAVWQMLDRRLLQFTTFDPPFAQAPGERPVASALARYQLRNGLMVTSMLHTTIEFGDAKMRAFVSALDGTRDRATLARDLQVGADQIGAELARLQRAGFLVG